MGSTANAIRFAIHGLILLTLLVGPVAGADDKSASSPKPESSTDDRYITFTHLDAYFELEAETTHSKIKSRPPTGLNFGRSQRNQEWRFEERIGLKLGGYLIDPMFINFNADFSFALTQDRFEENFLQYDRRDRDNGHLLQYNLQAQFLPGRKLSGSLHALRQDDRINRRFQPTLNQRRTGFGTSWVRNDKIYPMELTYDYLETDRTGNRDNRDDEHYTESSLRYGLEWIVASHNRFKFDLEHVKTKQEFQGLANPFETTRDRLNIEHQYLFGEKRKHSLRTVLRWQEESGDFARDLFEFGPQLTYVHNKNLQSFYQYQYNRERYEGLDIESQRLDFQLTHQAYTNLISTFSVFALFEDIENDINTTQYGSAIDWQYNRKNRHGHLYANLALAFDTEEIDGDNGARVILDEAHNFRDPVAATLRNRNVIRGTILVTDTTNRRVYRLGIDYILFNQGNVTRITRVRTGLIADGDTILVDYQIKTPSHGQLDTTRVDFSIEQRFTSGLTPYYRLSYRNQEDDISSGFNRRADRTNHHRMGFNYKTKGYTYGAEYEIFDDTVEPYDAFHLNGQLHILNRQDRQIDATSRFSRMFFEGGLDDRNVSLLDVSIDHRYRLSDAVYTVERVAWRYQDDSAEGITTGWDVTAGLEYVMGDLSGELTFEYDRLELPSSKQDDYGIYFRIRRELQDVWVKR